MSTYSWEVSSLGERPIRRRSITSPRTPFTPFSPVLTFRSPILPTLDASPPTQHEEDVKTKKTPLILNSAYRLPRKSVSLSVNLLTAHKLIHDVPKPRGSNEGTAAHLYGLSHRFLVFLKHAVTLLFALGSVVVWLVTWRAIRHSFNERSITPLPLLQKSLQKPILHLGFRAHQHSSDHSFALGSLNTGYPDLVPHPFQLPMDMLVPVSSLFPSISVFALCPSDDIMVRLSDLFLRLKARFTSSKYSTTLLCLDSQAREVALFIGDHESDAFQLLTAESKNMSSEMNLIHAAAQSSSDWVLLIGEDGIPDVPVETLMLLQHPPEHSVVPFGPHGVSLTPLNASCIVSHSRGRSSPTSAAFLVPPFSIRTESLQAAEHALFLDKTIGTWANLGRRISHLPGGRGVGGLVVGLYHNESWNSCDRALQQVISSPEVNTSAGIEPSGIGLDSLRHGLFERSQGND